MSPVFPISDEAARPVTVTMPIERPTGAVARCSLVYAAVARVQEIPIWMLDAAVCCQTRLAGKPVAAFVRPCRIADPAFGSDADSGNRGAIRCRDSIYRFL